MAISAFHPDFHPHALTGSVVYPPVVVCGQGLTAADVVRVARHGARVRLTSSAAVLARVGASSAYIADAVGGGELIYGVTSGFGGMANVLITPEEATELQNNLIWFLRAGAGRRLPKADVRAAMLIRANSHLHGASGLRLRLLPRIE